MKRKRVKGFNYLFLFMFAVMFSFSNLWASNEYEKEIESISKTMADKIAASGKKKVAVVDFTDLQGNVNELGRFIAEKVSTFLVKAKKEFFVVDRTHLNTLLKEHKLSAKGLIDPATARKLGKIAGAEALVTGTLTPLGDSLDITIKLLDTETAIFIDSGSGNIPLIKAFKDLINIEVGSVNGQSGGAYKKSKPGKSQQEMEDFVFELKHCKVSDRTVTCTVMITNNADDREFGILGLSRIYDNFGNEHRLQIGQIANKKIQLFGKYYAAVKKVLISGIQTKAILTFQKVNSKATTISSFRINCLADGEFSVNFRNIPLIK